MADTMVYTSEKMMAEAGDKVSAEEKKEVEEKIAALKAVKDGDDHEAIKKAADELTNSAQKIGAKMYAAQQPAGAQEATSEEPKKDEPIDAEFEEKKE